jgi:hypothetical protein
VQKEPVPITGLWLRTLDKRLHVLIELNGQWKLVNDYPLTDGAETIIGHITDSAGMLLAPCDPYVKVRDIK